LTSIIDQRVPRDAAGGRDRRPHRRFVAEAAEEDSFIAA
jgi:hypothetical protein